MASFLPFHPWLSLGLRVFSFQRPEEGFNPLLLHPLLHFDATLAFYPHLCRRSPFTVSLQSTNFSTSLELLRPSASSGHSAHFFTVPFETASESYCPASRCPSLRVWLPSLRCQLSITTHGLFQPFTLMGSSLQSFVPPRWSAKRFHPAFRSCTSV